MSSIIKKENCVPSLRFPEFDTKWTFIKLYDVTTSFDYGLAYPSKKFDGENKYIRITDIDEETNSYCKDDIVSPDGKLTKEYLVNADDILFARTGASTGKTYLYNHKDGTLYFAGFLIRAHIKEEINSKFVFLNTQTLRYKKWVAITSMRSGQPGINSQEYANFKFYLPDKKEQDKISDFITLIDNLIAKQIKYISTFETYNKGLISKIFKQEIRFKDDNGNQFPDWEEDIADDVCVIQTGSGNTQDKEDNGIYPFFVRSSIIEHSNKYIFDCEAVLTVGDGVGTGKVYHYMNGKFNCHQRVYAMTNFKNILGKYFYYYFKIFFPKRVYSMSAKTSVDSVRREMIANMKIFIPCLDEQKKISEFLSSMDRVLEQEKVYVDQLKTIKKGLLQQMFV